MTDAPRVLLYASPNAGNCPLCHKRPIGRKSIYGTPVCKKCYYAFANRRQLAFLIDSIIYILPVISINIPLDALGRTGLSGAELQGVMLAVQISLACLFAMKDGFSGQSPGKRITDLQVLDDRTGQPISFVQSLKRNSFLFLGLIPVLGGVANLIVFLIIISQLSKGYRLGDRFAQTRVIWKKYARQPLFGGDGLICETCGYDLHGNVSGICPECGTPLSERSLALLNSAAAAT